MARRLLGKEVTAALNEKIKENVAALKAKGISPTLGIVRVGEREDDLSYEREPPSAARLWELPARSICFRQMSPRKSCWR